MDLDNIYRGICKSCGGQCCKGAVGLSSRDDNKDVIWFFPNKIKGYFYPPSMTLEDKRLLLNRLGANDKSIEPCDWYEKGGCSFEDRPDYCRDFYCEGIIDMLEELTIG